MSGYKFIINFGKYKEQSITAEMLFEKDPFYCLWLTKQKYFRNNHKNLIQYLDKKIIECSSIFDLKNKLMTFGKYQGLKPHDFIFDQKYCKWLLKHKSFSLESPNLYNNLQSLYQAYYQHKCYNFYVLFFIDQPFVKIGYTEQSIVRRIYNYYFDSNYTALKIDFEKSLIYHTNYSKIESRILNDLDRFRLNKQEEKLSLEALPYIDIQMKVIENEDGFCVQKISMQKVIPFKNNHVWRDLFYVKKTDYKNFDGRYIECLKSNNLFDQYNLYQFISRFN